LGTCIVFVVSIAMWCVSVMSLDIVSVHLKFRHLLNNENSFTGKTHPHTYTYMKMVNLKYCLHMLLMQDLGALLARPNPSSANIVASLEIL
jgi:hypothetical protein